MPGGKDSEISFLMTELQPSGSFFLYYSNKSRWVTKQ